MPMLGTRRVPCLLYGIICVVPCVSVTCGCCAFTLDTGRPRSINGIAKQASREDGRKFRTTRMIIKDEANMTPPSHRLHRSRRRGPQLPTPNEQSMAGVSDLILCLSHTCSVFSLTFVARRVRLYRASEVRHPNHIGGQFTAALDVNLFLLSAPLGINCKFSVLEE